MVWDGFRCGHTANFIAAHAVNTVARGLKRLKNVRLRGAKLPTRFCLGATMLRASLLAELRLESAAGKGAAGQSVCPPGAAQDASVKVGCA